MDIIILKFLNSFAARSNITDDIIVFFADYLGYLIVAALILFLLQNFKKNWPLVSQSLISAVIARFGITELIRLLWLRPRPFTELELNIISTHEPTGSFPSGHAAFFFAIAAIIYFYNKKAGSWLFFTAFLIGLARVVAGLHWPSDIIGGAVVGILTSWLVFKVFKKIGKNNI
ncbi:MAG: phosphatase PAP2 family protein [bacterium]|nr:phosphatase PAP2 family protein [bacterium]